MEQNKTSFWQRISNGDLGSFQINTAIALDSRSLVNLGLTVFVAGVLVILAYSAIKKVI